MKFQDKDEATADEIGDASDRAANAHCLWSEM